MFRSIHPYDQSVVGEFPLMTARDVEQKLTHATRVFASWKRTSFAHRAERMLRLAAILRQNKDDYARVITLEMGKVLSESHDEIEKSAGACEYFALQAERLLADQPMLTEAHKTVVAYQPTGAILAIMPWNFPFWQVIRFAAPALMAGNVALLKHAPNVTQCSLLLESIFQQAGFPEGVFQSLVIDTDLVEPVIQADIVHGVALTGSERAGSSVAAIAGKHIKKSVLELGGSDPLIVLHDADLDKAVAVAVQSRMRNAGQSCIAGKRIIVVKEISEAFIAKYKEKIDALVQGDPFDKATTVGPLARIDLAEALEKQLAASVNRGAILQTGGDRAGSNFKPALLTSIRPGMPAFDEETFGPVAGVITATSEQEAIDLANATRYGLGASVWTRDIERGERIAREIESGSVFINSIMRSDVRLPFGGTKKSGYGREMSELGLKEFMNAKVISIA